jgi:DNA-binding transcriptional LysR family regulator
MEVFVKVAEVGSFTKAADALEMSRPQATLTIQELEKSIGARLFHRTTSKVSLTADGEAFYDRAKEVLGNVAMEARVDRSGAACAQCGVAGFGMIQLPGFLVVREMAEGTLVEVLKPFRPKPRPVSLLYPSRTHVAPQVNAFADWLRTRFPALQSEWIEG